MHKIDQILTCWVVALNPEGIGIREKYKMKSVTHNAPFPIFSNDLGSDWLIVSGIGRANVAAATMCLYHVSNAPAWTVWINIGIAGHCKNDFGSLYLIDKITEEATGLQSYPRPAIISNIPKSSLFTVDLPKKNYKSGYLFDMEGSAFFNIACQLSCQQLVLMLKVVSDSPDYSFMDLTKKIISDLITLQIDKITDTVEKMRMVAREEANRLKLPEPYNEIINAWHFSTFQMHQLQHLLRCWIIHFPEHNIMDVLTSCRNANKVLECLSNKLDRNLIDWDKS